LVGWWIIADAWEFRPVVLPASVGRVSCWPGLADAVGIPPVAIAARTHPTAAGHAHRAATTTTTSCTGCSGKSQQQAQIDTATYVVFCVRTYERTQDIGPVDRAGHTRFHRPELSAKIKNLIISE